MKNSLFILFILLSNFGITQNYTSYFTGNTTDIVTNPAGGLCLMGGATEDDNAMTWFLNQANGGDVLVIRASGSDGYNDYLYTSLGVTVNSVESIVWNNATASDEAYIHQKINQAEAIWIAGGDQSNYVNYWRGTAIDSLINKGIEERNLVIGGTSAGMAVMGQVYFSAANGTVTSATALNNPYDTNVTVESDEFFTVPFMSNIITDSHYDSPNRKGRHVVFLARMTTDLGFTYPKGIACNEYTAVCVDSLGIAKVYGGWPTWDEDAYFIQIACGDIINTPNCLPSIALSWYNSVIVYKVHGTTSGSNTFNLNDWETGLGGEWLLWEVDNGVLTESPLGYNYSCNLSIEEANKTNVKIYPNPSNGYVNLEFNILPEKLELINSLGEIIISDIILDENGGLDLSSLNEGVYYLSVYSNGSVSSQILIRR